MTTSEKMWGGRFSGHQNRAFERLNASIRFDWRLVAHDLWQNRCYAHELRRIGILSSQEFSDIEQALNQIGTEIESGSFTYSIEHEDIHLNLEARLTEIAGDAGKRIHTGRSRNDQVATVFRLWLRDALDLLSNRLSELIATTLKQADQWTEVYIPGYTHLQRAQIVSFGHHNHAYAEMFLRDLQRLDNLRERLNMCPLGSGALASSPYPIDRHKLAEDLKFSSPTRNSMDAVSDRDFALEFLFATSTIGLHLSRWAEDVILWMSTEFGWVRLPDSFCTGSSIMPQKKNPDLAELARGKSGRLLGHLTGLATALKGLPLTYNKDLQEDKEPVFDAWLTCFDLVDTWEQMIAEMTPVPENMSAALSGGHLLATDLADHLVQHLKVPFREAHHIVGQCVAAAERSNLDVSDLTLQQLQAIDARLDQKALDALNVEASIASRNRYGGPAPDQCRKNIAATSDILSARTTNLPEIPWAFALPQPVFAA